MRFQHLVDRIVKTASDEAERAAELVRAEAGLQLASAEALTNRLEAELNVARGELITTRQQFDAEHVARTRAEAEWHGAQAQYDQLVMERESELQRQRAISRRAGGNVRPCRSISSLRGPNARL